MNEQKNDLVEQLKDVLTWTFWEFEQNVEFGGSDIKPCHREIDALQPILAAAIAVLQTNEPRDESNESTPSQSESKNSEKMYSRDEQINVIFNKENLHQLERAHKIIEQRDEQIRVLRAGLEEINSIVNAVRKGFIKPTCGLYETVADETLAQADKIATEGGK